MLLLQLKMEPSENRKRAANDGGRGVDETFAPKRARPVDDISSPRAPSVHVGFNGRSNAMAFDMCCNLSGNDADADARDRLRRQGLGKRHPANRRIGYSHEQLAGLKHVSIRTHTGQADCPAVDLAADLLCVRS